MDSVVVDYLVDHYLLPIAMHACIFILFIYFILVMDMVIFRINFFELLVFFTFTLLTLHFAY